MKLKTLAALLTGSLLGLTLLPAGFAQDDTRRFEGGRGPQAGMQGRRMQGAPGMMPRGMRAAAPGRMLARLDSDDDGRISEDEFVDGRTSRIDTMFERRDTDGNGELSAEEAEPRRRAQRPQGPAPERRAAMQEAAQNCNDREPVDREQRFADTDTDGSGTLSLAEVMATAVAQAEARFADLDADGDGYVTDEELRANAQAIRERTMEVRECIRDTLRADD